MIKPRQMPNTAKLKDRFIVVMGGMIWNFEANDNFPPMTHCECYDTLSDKWFNINPLP